jgi:hypothetical protein
MLCVPFCGGKETCLLHATRPHSFQSALGRVATSIHPAIKRMKSPVVPPPYSGKLPSFSSETWHQLEHHPGNHFENRGNFRQSRTLLPPNRNNIDEDTVAEETCAEESGADSEAEDFEDDQTDGEWKEERCHGTCAYDDLPELGVEFCMEAIAISSDGTVKKEPLRNALAKLQNTLTMLSYKDMEALRLDRPDLAFAPLEQREIMQQN